MRPKPARPNRDRCMASEPARARLRASDGGFAAVTCRPLSGAALCCVWCSSSRSSLVSTRFFVGCYFEPSVLPVQEPHGSIHWHLGSFGPFSAPVAFNYEIRGSGSFDFWLWPTGFTWKTVHPTLDKMIGVSIWVWKKSSWVQHQTVR